MSATDYSSWHPAFMPNSAKELALAAVPQQKTLPPVELPEALKPAEEPHAELQSELPEQEDKKLDSREESPPLATLPESAPAPISSGADLEEENDFDSGIHPVALEDEKSDFSGDARFYGKRHLSTMSFTRTVSDGLDFGEEDEIDSEWNLNPPRIDPWKNMAQTARSNSFPAVPPTHAPVLHESKILATTEAEYMMNAAEQEPRDMFGDDDNVEVNIFTRHNEEHHDSENQPQETYDSNSEPDLNIYGPAFGENAHTQPDEALEARFEEGIPLVQSYEDIEPVSTAEDAFGGDDGDDFFSQVSQPDQSGAPFHAPMERKSTSQILETMQFQPQEAIEDAIEQEQLAPEPLLEDDDGDNFKSEPSEEFHIGSRGDTRNLEAPQKEPSETDLAAKWKAMLDEDEFLEDEDELLPDDDEILPTQSQSIDPADLFGSDDEGFLEDTDEPDIAPEPQQAVSSTVNGQASSIVLSNRPSSSDRYTPLGFTAATAQPTNPYAPAPLLQDLSRRSSNSITPVYASPTIGNFQPPQQARPELPKAQSFADKAKGGYSSPYDLPMEVVKPRKRPSTGQTPRGLISPQPNAPPPRSSSVYSNQSVQSNASMPPPSSSQSSEQQLQQQPLPSQPVKTVRKAQSGFFEDLPMTAKPRQPLRHASSFVAPSPSFHGQTSPSIQPPLRGFSPYAPIQNPPQSTAPIAGLVAPERVSPYTPLPTGNMAVPPVASRYSPAPQSTQSAPPPVAQPRYSPAPPSQRQIPPVAAPVNAPPPPLLHQPRTSSPLAHFERNQDPRAQLVEPSGYERRSSSTYESNLRTSHLPPTDEVDENDLSSQPQSQYSQPPPQAMRHTPPPRTLAKTTMSPPKRVTSNYLPQQQNINSPHSFAPPQRSQTQSPGASFGGPRLGMTPLEPYQRPASVELPPSPLAGMVSHAGADSRQSRPRGFSQGLNYIAPIDGREHDPLQRWRGAPIFVWGVGGTLVTSFPRDIPRYGMGQSAPMIIRSPGEIRVKNIKDVDPLPERLTSFPGPLKGKSKKKEVISWLTAGINILEQDAAYLRTTPTLSHEDKRIEERILLWKVLRVFIENDGLLEGNPTVNKAVQAVLSPEVETAGTAVAPLYATGSNLSGITASASGSRSEPVDPTAVEALRKHLLKGEREKAVWEAVDKRLWAHAMLISNTVSKDLYKQVSQEFVQKEVKNIGDNTESLAALYDIFSGNFEESIDELVPPSARAGFQMISTSKVPAAKDALEGLDRWRETLGLVLSNRSPEDSIALNALGKLLSGYGRAEAAHICFLFGRSHTLFGGIDDPGVNVVLVGADHLRQPHDFDKEMEPILLSETFEYGMSLSNASNIAISSPHLSVYKLQHATILAEYGHRDKAIQYCDAILASMTSQTRRLPYHHAVFTENLEDLYKRLKQSPKDESSSWISKPSMDKVGGSLLATFNKFVAGDNDETASNGSGAGSAAEVGPFARIAGGTPTISRSPSQTDFYGTYGAPTNGIPIPSTKTASRYAPGGQHAPSSFEHQGSYTSQPANSHDGRSSSELKRHEPQRQMSDYRPSSQHSNNYAPQPSPSLYTHQTPYMPYSPREGFESGPPYQPQVSTPITDQPPSSVFESPQPLNNFDGLPQSNSYSEPSSRKVSAGYEPPTSSSYQPPSSFEAPAYSGYQRPATNNDEASSGGFEPPASTAYEAPSSSGYEPPASSGYEPPVYQPYEPSTMDDEPDSPIDTRPKKKSFMDDDDDDIPALKKQTATTEKTKAEKDREADEAFRKAAEADAAKAAAAPSAKKGWGLTGWWGGKKEPSADVAQPNKPIRAKLGEESSFYYDPDLKRWVNKKGGAEETAKPTSTPPPPRAGPPRSVSGNAPPQSLSRPGSSSGPPQRQVSDSSPAIPSPLAQSDATPPQAIPTSLAAPPLGPTSMARSVSNGSAAGGLTPSSRPPSAMSISRPGTGLSHSSSIDDLLGPAGLKKGKGAGGTAKGKRKGRGYVDVMASEK